MAKKRIVKSIPIDGNLRAKLQALFLTREALAESLGTIIEQAIRRQVEQQEEMWDELAILAGFDSMMAVDGDGKSLRISWMRCCIDVTEKVAGQDTGQGSCED